jgi:hypothetical protein
MLSASAKIFTFVGLVVICSHSATAQTPIPDSVALQQSFCLFPASTIPPGQRVSGDINGYHIECVGGTNRVPNSNTVPCNGNLGTVVPGTPRVCTGYQISPGSAAPPPPPPPSQVTKSCTQGANYYVIVVPENPQVGQYRIQNNCLTYAIKVDVTTYDVQNQVSTSPVQIPAGGSQEIDSYNGNAPQQGNACFVGQGC